MTLVQKGGVGLKSPQQIPDRNRFDALVVKLQECETEAHELGFILTAHKINAAKNQTGWDMGDQMDRAASQTGGGQP